MPDKPVALLVTTLIGAPLLIVCCGGGIAALLGMVGGFAGLFSGFGLLASLLLALVVMTITTVARHRRDLNHQKPVVGSRNINGAPKYN